MSTSRLRMVVLSLLFAAGCGSGVADPTSTFVGSWEFGSGVGSASCPAGVNPTLTPFRFNGMRTTVTRSGAGTITAGVGDTGCTMTFRVDGTTASASPGQTCKLPFGVQGTGMGGAPAVAISLWTLNVAPDGLLSAFAGTAGACTVSGTGGLIRTPGGG